MVHQVFGTFILLAGHCAVGGLQPGRAVGGGPARGKCLHIWVCTVWRTAPRNMRLLAGGGGIVFVTVLGNLDGAVQWFTRLAANAGPNRLRAGWDWLGQTVGNLLRGEPPPGFDYWHSTRLIEGAIHEFPFFTFSLRRFASPRAGVAFHNGDTGACLGLCLELPPQSHRESAELGPDTPRVAAAVCCAFPRCPCCSLAALCWDFCVPRILGTIPRTPCSWAGAVILVERRGLIRLEVPANVRVVAAAVGLYLVGRLAFGPYLDNYQSFFLGVRSIDDQTPLWQYLVIHGVLVFFVAIFLVRELFRWRAAFDIRLIAILAVLQIVLASVLWQRPIVLLLQIIILLASAGSAGSSRQAPRPPAGRHGGAGAGIGHLSRVFLPSTATSGRMNTVFKFYLQAWNLLALAAAATLPLLWQQARLRRFLLPIGALLVLLALLYPLSAIPHRAQQRLVPDLVTLDGTAFMREGVIVDQDREIPPQGGTWRQSTGCKTTLAARQRCWKRPSRTFVGERASLSHTGLPTVLGWDSHEWLQRWEYRPHDRATQAGYPNYLRDRGL